MTVTGTEQGPYFLGRLSTLVDADLRERPAHRDGHGPRLAPGPQAGLGGARALRTRWDLHLGSSLELLPGLLGEGSVDVFLHDSDHTFATMDAEIRLAWPALRPG